MPLCLYNGFFINLITILILTALLICMENTFWNIRRDGSFVKSFKKSFTLYVKSGMMNRMEAELDRLRFDESGDMTRIQEFKTEFCDIVIEHCLSNCKFHCSYLHLLYLTNFSKIQPTGIKFLSWKKRMRKSLLGCRN